MDRIIIIIIIIIQFADHKNELSNKNEGTSPNSQRSTRFHYYYNTFDALYVNHN